MAETLNSSEYMLIELKAKVENHDSVRERLGRLKAYHAGTFRQIDTYFYVPKGMLKLRQIEGKGEAELIYYEREETDGPKESKVFIVRILKPETFRTFFEKVLKKKVTVGKRREIYRYRGTQIHLDAVDILGNFVELEREIRGSGKDAHEAQKILEAMMAELGVEKRDLIKGSYSDLLSLR